MSALPIIQTRSQVWYYSLLITALAVVVPVGSIGALLWCFPLVFMPLVLKWQILAVAGIIPLFIAFPVAYFGLSIALQISRSLAERDARQSVKV